MYHHLLLLAGLLLGRDTVEVLNGCKIPLLIYR